MSGSSDVDVRRRAGWLPEQEALEEWIEGHRARARSADAPLSPVLEELRDLIQGDPVLRMHAHQMIQQVPAGKPYGKRHVDDLDELLRLIDAVLTLAPEYSEDTMVSTPLGAVLDWTTGTPAGFAFYRDPRVNAALRKILNSWGTFLSSPDSLTALNESSTGWRSTAARKAVGIEQFEHDPADEHWGFTSWNDFFTRRFRPGVRPVAAPEDGTVIVAPCEAWVEPGTYYSHADSQGAASLEPTSSQGYLAHVATRAIVLLQADDPAIRLVAFVPIGMEDVSTCVLAPGLQPGAHVDKGDELGWFQFGGSTYCLLFQPGVVDAFALTALPMPDDPSAPLVPVRSALAIASAR